MSDLTLSQIAAIEATARQATPGPWKFCPSPLNITDDNAVEVADCSYHIEDGGTEAQARANAAYLLNCQPDVILSLCQMARPKTCATCGWNEPQYEQQIRCFNSKLTGIAPLAFKPGLRAGEFGCSLHEARQGQETS